MRLKNKNVIQVTLAAGIASLYAVGVVFLAPISFQVFQVRIADALLPLSILIGWPAVLGLSIGAFVANFFGGLGPVDIIGGTIANFIATLIAWKITLGRERRSAMIAGIVAEITVVTVIVGTYLSFLLGIPLWFSLLGILLGSIVAIGLLGTIVLFALSSSRVSSILRPNQCVKDQKSS
jgi:uncharacterized membrane protein